jgi:hypothetical protein
MCSYGIETSIGYKSGQTVIWRMNQFYQNVMKGYQFEKMIAGFMR